MTPTEPARVSVRILEKEYFVACPHEERAALLDAAEFLNGRMREIRDTGKVVGLDRVAVMPRPKRPKVMPAARFVPCASASRPRWSGRSSSSCETHARQKRAALV